LSHEGEAVVGLHHQFDTTLQQKEAASFGMWLFLVTEALFFGGLFCAYTIYRWSYPESFTAASRTLNIQLGTFNTAVLIGSSLTMALAVRAAQLGKNKLCALLLALTILLGAVFLGVKAKEYADKFEHHHVPGPTFHFEGEGASHAQMYFCLYFAMTGLHAFHMIIGAGLLTFVIVQALRNKYSPSNYNFVEGVGLYWHFVDLVWIFLFPLLYLIGRHH